MQQKLPFRGNALQALLLLTLMLFSVQLKAQDRVVTGTVKDVSDQSSIPGVNIQVKGTTLGTVTDIDGQYSIKIPEGGTALVFSYIGYQTKTVEIGALTTINVSLDLDTEQLDEVIVIGYGVQKKKLNTGATLNMDGETIQKLNTPSAMDALKGIAPGVSISKNSGAPGASSKVTIRGAGTIGNASPLYVVDGVAVGDIDYLSPADIESIDVLKDAASAAIYGSRAANGVILVTTKQGTKSPKPMISYDMYYGVQQALKKPELLNAQQYIQIMNEAKSNSGQDPYKWGDLVPNFEQFATGANKGVDWFEEMYNHNAPIQNHNVNITGGAGGSTYSMGFGYINQEGIVGKGANNTYERINLRLNSDHVLIEAGDRAIVKLGQNLSYSNFSKPTIRNGNIYYNDLHNALVTSPLLPMYAEDKDDPAYPYHYATNWNIGESNPIADMINQSKYNTNENNTLVGNAYLSIEPIEGLTLRTSYGVNSWFGNSRKWTPAFDLGPQKKSAQDQVDQSMWSGLQWTWTTTASYNKQLGKHNITALLGHERLKESQNLKIEGHNENSLFQEYKYAYLSNVPVVKGSEAYLKLNGRDDFGWGLMSYFGRLSYDFNETLLITGVLRADGSSRFVKGKQWGVFPSISAGYILSNHAFMDAVPGLSFFKLRGSWGQNGNENIGNFQYLSSISFDAASYFFGPKTNNQIGGYPARVPNPNVTWETSEQSSVGFDVNFLNDKLQLNVDFYQKLTKDWLVQAPSLATDGTDAPYINGGEVSNTGYEISLGWNETKGDFAYGATFTLSHNQNKVVAIDNDEKIIHGPANVLSQGTGEMFRAEVGYPMGYFWGLQTNGILQNQAEADAYVGPEGEKYFSDQQAGDVRFVDQNNDGKIDDKDRVMIGDPNPDYIVGLQLNAAYKGVYVSAVGVAQMGHQVIRSWRSFADSPKQNYTTDVLDRWHGEGTSTTKPRITAVNHQNMKISDLYVEDADFFRLSNLTIGYDFNTLFKEGSPMKNVKVYYTGMNLLVLTKYSGMDPEIGYGPDNFGWASGIDLGLYPSSRTHMLGLSVKF